MKELKTLFFIKYFITIGNFEKYFDFTGYLQSSVHYYAQISQFLQKLKIMMLKSIFITRSQNFFYVFKTKLFSPSNRKIESFKFFQPNLLKRIMLVHFN